MSYIEIEYELKTVLGCANVKVLVNEEDYKIGDIVFKYWEEERICKDQAHKFITQTLTNDESITARELRWILRLYEVFKSDMCDECGLYHDSVHEVLNSKPHKYKEFK